MKRVVQEEIPLDIWVINHFGVLPTDDRYLRLTDRTKYLLFIGWLENPTSEQIHTAYERQKAEAAPSISSEDEANFSHLGYTAAQIDRMKKELAKAYG